MWPFASRSRFRRRVHVRVTLGMLLVGSAAVGPGTHAQGRSPSIVTRPPGDVARLAAMPPVRAALDAIRGDEARTIQDQIRLCEIPAPPLQETARAHAYAEQSRAAGPAGVNSGAAGNVIGERKGQTGGPHLGLGAHLDTNFPEETRVAVTRVGSVLRGPGIADNCRGLAV